MGFQINSFFDKRALHYQQKSLAWPWRSLREKEKQVILKMLEPKANEHLLDVGCGSGYYSRILANDYKMHVVGVDQSQAMISTIPKLHTLNCFCCEFINFKSNEQFDKILAAGVLEFNQDVDSFFANCNKHLKNNGRLVILIPTFDIFGFIYKFAHHCPTQIRTMEYYTLIAKKYNLESLFIKEATFLSNAILFQKS